MPFEIGALYNRQRDIHSVRSGQKQGGISTPAGKKVWKKGVRDNS